MAEERKEERKMVDSGVAWIGNIPEVWKVIPVKYCFDINNGSDPKSTEGEIPVYGSGTKSFKTCKEYKDGPTVLLGRKGTVDIPQWIEGRYWNVDTAFDVKSKGIYDLKLFYYAATCFDYRNYMTQTALPSMTQNNYYNFRLPYMNTKEQRRIADFLDSKCSEIDALAGNLKERKEGLKKYRRAVITEAVTKGLDDGVKMKESGVEWIGMIPEEWSIHPVYTYFSERKNKNTGLKEKNLLSLSYGCIIRKDINSLGGLLPQSFSTYNIVQPGDIIIRPTDLQNDKRSLRTGLVTEKGIITSAYINLVPILNINSKYFHYLLHSYDVNKVFYNMGNGVRQGLNYSEFSKLMLICPPLSEQHRIADYLDAKCSEIDKLMQNYDDQLTALAEYKKSLIYEYVTGKKEVPEP